jgi:hypothetical protein
MKGKIFNSQEVQSMISGNKTQFREVVKPAAGLQSTWASVELLSKCTTNYLCEVGNRLGAQFQHPLAGTTQSYGYVDKMSPLGWFQCPYQVGQKIFCKESFYQAFKKLMYYKASWESAHYYKNEDYRNRAKCIGIEWKPAQHMKQEHSRLTLEITGVKVERLAELDEITMWEKEGFNCHERIQNGEQTTEVYRKLWNATHKKPEEKFEANPWVWVISFEVGK